jgi:hypothetical protein
MKKLEWDNYEDLAEIVSLSFANAYDLLVGNMTFDELSQQDEFYLPKDWEDAEVLLRYYEEEEDYERCNEIIKQQK